MNKAGEIKKHIGITYPRLGINKKREISRLVFEISKREGKDYKSILNEIDPGGLSDFRKMKKYLLKRRFPRSNQDKLNPYLPLLQINPDLRVRIERKKFSPEKIYYDRFGEKSEIFKKARNIYSGAELIKIKSLKKYVKEKEFSIKEYNLRRKKLFITGEKYDFVKNCPCTSDSVNCGYNIINMGFGCPYECTYCYLQEYTNTPGIVVPANPGDFIKELEEKVQPRRRYGTGEFTDSLALDEITGFSNLLIEFFKGTSAVLELKTKSANVENVLKTKPPPNCVISWSLNPESFIEDNEFYTAPLRERLQAAAECSKAGYDIGFHFDPIVLYFDWEKNYRRTVKMMFKYVPAGKIRWISLGTFRFKRELKKIIENRFPKNKILDGELSIDFDGKLRYPFFIRLRAYRNMIKWIQKESSETFIYLCMEDKKMWKEAGLKPTWRWNRN